MGGLEAGCVTQMERVSAQRSGKDAEVPDDERLEEQPERRRVGHHPAAAGSPVGTGYRGGRARVV